MRRAAMFAIVLLYVLGQIAACTAADPPVKTGKKRDTLLYVHTDPPGAKVLVNGKELGKSNNLFPVEAGAATIIVALEGHGQVVQKVTIRASGITRIEIELKPQPKTKNRQADSTKTRFPPPTRIVDAEATSRKNLHNLALAMIMYEQTHGHFPPAVLYGPDGKTPYSWRVELLPLLGQQPLYARYHFDEPWDGPNNRKLLEEKMPDVFRNPRELGALSIDACYFAIVGPGTIFETGKHCSSSEIKDGCSSTILLVEAKRNAPWTEPEDIPCDPNKSLPQLGIFDNKTINVAFADGSVRSLKNPMSKNLRALITRAGGEPVDLDHLDRPPRRNAFSKSVGHAIAPAKSVKPAHLPGTADTEEAVLRGLVARFVAAAAKGDEFPLKNVGPKLSVQATIKDMRRARVAGANVADVQLTRIKGNRALVVTKFANITDRKYIPKNPHCVIYTWEKQGNDWVLNDIDLEDKIGLADKLRRLDAATR